MTVLYCKKAYVVDPALALRDSNYEVTGPTKDSHLAENGAQDYRLRFPHVYNRALASQNIVWRMQKQLVSSINSAGFASHK